MPIVDLRGQPSYVEVDGEGEPLLLLHGGFCSLETLRPVGERLADAFTVVAAERPGHGRTPDRDGPYDYADGVTGTLALLEAQGLPAAHLVGYSDGAIIALLLALEHPDRVLSLTLVSANLDPDGFADTPDTDDTDADDTDAGTSVHDQLAADYAALSPDGPEHAEVVLTKLRELWAVQPQIPVAALADVTAPTLVMAGERDLVARAHTLAIAGGIAGSRLEIVAGTTHALVVERADAVADRILLFLAGLPR